MRVLALLASATSVAAHASYMIEPARCDRDLTVGANIMGVRAVQLSRTHALRCAPAFPCCTVSLQRAPRSGDSRCWFGHDCHGGKHCLAPDAQRRPLSGGSLRGQRRDLVRRFNRLWRFACRRHWHRLHHLHPASRGHLHDSGRVCRSTRRRVGRHTSGRGRLLGDGHQR